MIILLICTLITIGAMFLGLFNQDNKGVTTP